MHKLTALSLSLALIPTLSFGETKTDCKAFAADQLKEIKQEYYGALTRNEADLALEVAERSCRALFKTVEEERAAIQDYQPAKSEKTHWWEEVSAHEKATPTIKKAQQKGGK